MVEVCQLAGLSLGAASGHSTLFNRVFEGRFAEIRLGKRAPDLNLGDVGYVLGHRDLTVHFVAFDRQFLQQISVPFRVDDLPMRVGSIGSLEVIGQSQDAVAALGGMCHVTGVGLRAFEFRGGVRAVPGGAGRWWIEYTSYGSLFGGSTMKHQPWAP